MQESAPEVEHDDEVEYGDPDVEQMLERRLVVRDANKHAAQWVRNQETADELARRQGFGQGRNSVPVGRTFSWSKDAPVAAARGANNASILTPEQKSGSLR